MGVHLFHILKQLGKMLCFEFYISHKTMNFNTVIETTLQVIEIETVSNSVNEF